jgi:hypothetical protein
MGMTRKFLSLNTLGLIDYRSAKDKAAMNTRKTKKAAKKTARHTKRIADALERAETAD